ncbi:MAG: class I SAM-dependent methyltransferase [Planctomycetes bacterium]|nr:class I SAM-dependent methyltransferase [Planctomycetota bacterium]
MKCYLCGSENNELVSEKLRYESPRKVYKCRDCSLVFLYPQMSPEEERIFYEKEYGEIYSHEKGATPADLFKARQGDAKVYFDLTKNYLNSNLDCLEIGCASGYFLAEIKDKVRSVAGIETHRILREHCEKISIKMYDSLDDAPASSFDMVFLFFVLEHLGDPFVFFKKVNRILKKGGKIFIEIPNVDDALLSLYDIPGFRIYYYTPAHQFYYSKNTLAKLFDKASCKNYEIKIIQRYDLSNHMHWMSYGKPGGVGKFNHIFSPELVETYKRDLVKASKGDGLIAVITKD